MNSSLKGTESIITQSCFQPISDESWKFFYNVILIAIVLLLSCLIVALVKNIVNLPHTVIFIFEGIVFGFIIENINVGLKTNDIFRYVLLNPVTILQLFLPYLIFGSTFMLETDLFLSVANCCVILGILGFILSTCIMYIFALYLHPIYMWNQLITVGFAAIVFITDPFFIGHTLKNESGEMKYMCIILEGEGLINNTFALLILNLYNLIMNESCNSEDIFFITVKIILKSLLSGFVFGKIVNFGLHMTKNDTITEITIYLTVPYVVFFFNEDILNGNGFLAVFVAGFIISRGKDSLPPDELEAVKTYWKMLNYILDTFIFIIIGILIVQLFLNPVIKFEIESTTSEDIWVIQNYILVQLIRMATILILYLVFKKFGYDLKWKDTIVLIWVSTRGIVSLLLSLYISFYYGFDDYRIGKMLFQVGGISFLTLFNHISARYLLNIIGVSTVSLPGRARMIHAVTHLRKIIAKSIKVQHLDQFMSVANWQWIKHHTYIEDPYKSTSDQLEAISYFKPRTITCSDCFQNQPVILTKDEQEELLKELNIRALKSAKIYYWKQFNMGLIRRETARLMASLASRELSRKNPRYLDATVVIRFMIRNELYDLLGDYAKRYIRSIDRYIGKEITEDKGKSKNVSARRMIYSTNYEYLLHSLLIVPLIMVLITSITNFKSLKFIEKSTKIFIPCAQILVLSTDSFLRIRTVGFKTYVQSHINQLSIFLIVVNVLLIIKWFLYYNQKYMIFFEYFYYFVIFRLILIVKLICICVNEIAVFSINSAMHQNFDMALCFLLAEEENIKKVEFMLEYTHLVNALKEKINRNKRIILRELMEMQHMYPVSIIAAKRRLASRRILFNGLQAVIQMKEDGILGEYEYIKLLNIIENKTRNLLAIPSYKNFIVKPTVILKNVKWITGSEKLEHFCKLDYDVWTFPAGTILHKLDKYASSMYIIVSGIVKVIGTSQYQQSNLLPFTNSFLYFYDNGSFEDCLSVCETLGLIGILNNAKSVTETICETDVTVIIISLSKMRYSFRKFSDPPSLQYEIWRFVALQVALPLLIRNPYYKFLSIEKLKQILEKAIIPDLYGYQDMVLSNEVLDAILIQGKVKTKITGEVFRGPICLPRYVKHLLFNDVIYDRDRTILLLLTVEDFALPDELDWSGNDGISKKRSLCLTHLLGEKLLKEISPKKNM
ncbi:sperm-specific sodium:proton exchanger-like [Centruroides vittatus]|uniref:sperm-specific sodium:proton exchanger-like n=1 Tax=Centruroides vittatus TaxID=120091 RepID=UPI00350FDCB4